MYSYMLSIHINIMKLDHLYYLITGLGLWCLTPLSTMFQLSYIVEFSFIGGGHRNTKRKLPTCHKSVTKIFT